MSIVRGNDEIAFWLKTASESENPEEITIAAYLAWGQCPRPGCMFDFTRRCNDKYCYERHKEGYKVIFEHYKVHMGMAAREEAIRLLRISLYLKVDEQARREGNPFWINEGLTRDEYVEKLLNGVSEEEIEYIIHTKVSDKYQRFDNLVYAMLQQLIIFEVNRAHRNIPRNADTRALVAYKLNKDFGLPIDLVGELIGMGRNTAAIMRI
jgi:hypothetical protein